MILFKQKFPERFDKSTKTDKKISVVTLKCHWDLQSFVEHFEKTPKESSKAR